MTSPEYTGPEDTLVTRLSALQTDHPWMEPQVATTLATSPTSDEELHSIAASLRDGIRDTWDGISYFFDDPVLTKQPTTKDALRRYLNSTLGPSPVSDSSLAHIQTQLLNKGLGEGLVPNGVWDAQWQQVLQQHTSAEWEAQQAGAKPGSVTSGGLLRSVLGAITPAGMADAVLGFAKSIPEDARQLASDLGGAVSQAAHGAETLVTDPMDLFKRGGETGEETREARGRGQALVNQALGGDLTVEQAVAKAGTSEDLVNLINDVGTLFLLSGGKTATTAVKTAVKKARAEGMLTRISTEEAIRSQQVIARTLLRPAGTRAAAGAATGAVAGGAIAGVRGEDISQGAIGGALLGGLTGAALPQRAFDNLPFLKHTGPTLGKLLDDKGLYYTARTRLATPYQYGAVRAAGTTMAQAQAFSLKAHGTAYLQELFGDEAGAIAQSIENVNALDSVDAALRDRLAFTAAGVHFEPDLDYLMFFLHGPMKVGSEGTASRAVGDTVEGLTDGFNDALVRTGAVAQIVRGTDQSFDDLLREAKGDPDRLNMWFGKKVREAAAYQHAEEVVARLRAASPARAATMHADEWADLIRVESSAVFHDDDLMRTAVARLLGSGEHYLTRHIQNERTRDMASPRAYLRNQLGSYLDAGDILTHQILPHADRYLLTPTLVTSLPKGLDPTLWTKGVPDELMVTTSQMRTGPNQAGTIGLAKVHLSKDGVEDVTKSTLTKQQGTRDLHTFQQRLADADTLTKQNAVVDDMEAYLFHNHAQNAVKLRAYEGAPDKLINLIADRTKHLAAEIHLASDAPPELVQAFKQLRELGFRPVAGTDIGHAFRSDLPPLPDLGKPISQARKVVSMIGMNPERFGRLDYGADRQLRVTTALQNRYEDGRIGQLPPHHTVRDIVQLLQDDEIVGKQLPWAANLLYGAFRRAHKGAATELVASGQAPSLEHAEAILKANIASAGGLRNLSVKDVRRVLTREDPRTGLPLMSEKDATQFWIGLQEGFSKTPAAVLGLQKVEDFARYLPFQVAAHLPGGSKLTQNAATLAMLSLPTNIVRMRDHLRFTISPFFSLSNVAEANLKMGVDGVAGTFTPVKHLRDKGVYEQAHALLDRINGAENPRYKYLDEADRFLDQQDVFGLFNPRHYEAYYAHQKHADGWTDEQIREGLVRVFMYGARGKEGRTALERSVNVVWFPFSFQKSIVRNVGGYLLDKPAQALILANALDAYRDFNNHHLNGDNPLAASWYKQHLPILNEALRLNSFSRGISMGEFGGINRPLMNVFLPQSWEGDEKSLQTLRRFVPIVNDLRRIMKEGGEQTRIVRQSIVNGMSTLAGEPSYLLNARPSTKTSAQQRLEAIGWRNELITAFKPVLEYNEQADGDEQKYHFGTGPGIPDEVLGAVIDRESLGKIVHQQYPMYDPAKGAAFAIEKQRDAESWLAKRYNTPEYAQYKDFYDKAQTAIRHLNAEDYPIEQAAQVQALFHDAATEFASNDPEFYAWYKRTFARSLGPLEAVT